MDKKEEQVLNKSEKKEIVSDVKAAFNKANKNSITNHSNPQSKIQKIRIILTITIIVLIAFGILYWYLINNPQMRFNNSINRIIENIDNTLYYTNYTSAKGEIDLDYQNNVDATKNVTYNINYEKDTINNIYKENIIVNKNNTTDNFLIYTEKNKTYIKMNVQTEFTELDELLIHYNKKEVKEILSAINNALNKALMGQKFTSSNKTILIDKKKTKAVRTTLILDANSFSETLNNISTYLQKSSVFVDSYSKMFNQDKTMTKNIIADTINRLNQKYSYDDKIVINIYTNDNHDVVKLEFKEYQKDVVNTTSITKISENKYSYTFENQAERSKTESTLLITRKDNQANYQLTYTKKINEKDNLSYKVNFQIHENEATMTKENVDKAINFDNLPIDKQDLIASKIQPIYDVNNIFTYKK